MDDNSMHRRRGGSGRIWSGLFILLIGGVLLLDQMGFPLPSWLFSWHILLIAVGLFIGLRSGFRNPAWVILIGIGGFYLLQDYYPNYHFQQFIWPVILIFIGLMVMFSPRYNRWHHREWRHRWIEQEKQMHEKWKSEWKEEWHKRRWQQWENQNPADYTPDDFLESTSIFAGVHKKIVSKNFKGGDVTTMMGGTELDFSQADINGTVRLDMTQIMGGCKIIVPAHWEVRCEVTAIFAGFEDKRQQPAVINPNKVLILDGTSIFAGIELKNYL